MTGLPENKPDIRMKEGGSSKFAEDAAWWQVFDQTVAQARARFSDLPCDELQDLIDEAVAAG